MEIENRVIPAVLADLREHARIIVPDRPNAHGPALGVIHFSELEQGISAIFPILKRCEVAR